MYVTAITVLRLLTEQMPAECIQLRMPQQQQVAASVATHQQRHEGSRTHSLAAAGDCLQASHHLVRH